MTAGNHDGRRKADRWITLACLGVAAAAIVSAAGYFLNPATVEQTAAGRELHGLVADFYNALYLVAGVFVLAGAIIRRRLLELFGLWLLAATLSVNFLAILTSIGWASLRTGPVFFFAAAVVAARLELVKIAYEVAKTKKGIRTAVRDYQPEDQGPDRLLLIPFPVVPVIAAASGVNFPSIAAAVLSAGVLIGLTQVYNARREGRKLEAEAEEIEQRALDSTNARMDKLVERLENENRRLRDDVRGMQHRIEDLERREEDLEQREQNLLERNAELEARVVELEAAT